jgi:flagellin
MITVNTNMVSTWAAYNLSNTNSNLQKSLTRLSSGSRINSSMDDAGGLAVSMKLSAAIRRTEATQANVNNALSLLQTQDGVLKSAEKVLTRLAELAQLSADVTKSDADKSLYQTEFDNLTSTLVAMNSEEFNGIRLMTSDGATLNVVTSQDGTQTVGVSRADLNTDIIDELGITLTQGSISTHIATIDTAIQALAELRAVNGSEQVRLTFAGDMLSINRNTLEAANSRILDVDIAAESANLAKQNILQQAGASMLAQANQSSQSVLRLLV